MQSKQEIVLVTQEGRTQADVESALKQTGTYAPVSAVFDVPAMRAALERHPAHFVLVDIDPRPMLLLDELEPVINRFPQVRFVVLCSEVRQDVMFRAMQAGVRHIQIKGRLFVELPAVLERLGPALAPEGACHGAIITVLSASGGCGATTLTVNLANELQLTSAEQALIVDMDCSYGAVATYLELRGYYGIADVLGHAGGIDAQLVSTTAVRYSQKLHVLLSPATTDFGADRPLAPEHLGQALQACRHAYEHTFIDAPRVSMEAAATLATESAITLIVLQPTVKDIRMAKNIMEALTTRGVPRERLRPVVNRYRTRYQMVTMDEARKVLGNVPMDQLSNDYSSALRGINYGKPLATAAPRSTLRRELVKLAAEVCGTNSRNGAVRAQ